MQKVRDQYERFPYPPIPFLALPRRGEGAGLRYPEDAAGIRILVAGCGTFETAVVAQMHPRACEIVAVDLSRNSLKITQKRLAWMRLARPFSKLPKVTFAQGDLHELEFGEFDYILASNILQHVEDPARLLSRLSSQLKNGGWMRAVTYPKGSRHWMRETSRWLRKQGLDAAAPNLVRAAHQAIRGLPAGNAIRSCFDSQPETRTRAGLIDAFFHACENPLSPLEWQSACARAGLELVSEGQTETSRSSFLNEFVGPSLSPWEKLQIMDATWELCVNPVLWLRKTAVSVADLPAPPPYSTLAEQFQSAENLLKKAGKSLQEYRDWLATSSGPRVHPRHPSELLRGLSILDYDLEKLVSDH